jgi:hypothetical protein
VLQAGTTYYLQAGSIWPSGGELHVNLQLVPPPENDDFANATMVEAMPFGGAVDIVGATTEPDEPQYCEFIERTVWYSVTPTADGVIRADTYGSSFWGAGLSVYRATGSGFSGLNHVGCAMWNSSMYFGVHAGETYYIQAGNIWSESGELHVNLQLFLPPPNDEFSNAMAIAALPFSHDVETYGASAEEGEPMPSCRYSDRVATVWYAFTPVESGSVSARASAGFGTVLAVYTGASLNELAELGCRGWWALLTFRAEAGTTYYFQAGGIYDERGTLQFTLDVAPPPVASFDFSPYDPSAFDAIYFWDTSWDPGEVGTQMQAWDFGDGTTATGCCPTHQYAADGDYTVGLAVTTGDGRTASTSREVQVRTHDVAIIRLSAPQAASVGQTRQIAVEVSNRRYPENVEVQLFKSVPGGYQWVGTLNQFVPVRGGNRTTRFNFSYTFTSEDASLGKVTFRAAATILNARDALPADNEAISSPTKVSRR